MKKELTNEQLRALILNFIMRKGRWGKHYFPIDTMERWLSLVVENNGKNIKKTIKKLHNDGYLFLHKKNTTASLNPSMRHEIMDYIKKHLKE